MKAVKYLTTVLQDGRLSIPDEVKKELPVRKGDKLEVILSYITIKNKEEEIKALQNKIQEDYSKKRKRKPTIAEINKIVHSIRKANA